MEQLLENIYRIPVPLPDNPLKELNAYLIHGREQSLLIDTGFALPACREALEAGLSEIGVDRRTLDVLCSHIHTDHTGLSDVIAGPGRPVFIGDLDYPMLHPAYDAYFWEEFDRRFLREGFPPDEVLTLHRTNPARTLGPKLGLPVYHPLMEGQRLYYGGHTLQVLRTPGHTPGQLCLWLEKEGILFSSDHVLFDITPNIAMWPNMPNALGEYLDSLRKVRALPVRRTLPGHRHSGDLAARVDELFAHHRARVAETRAIVREEPGLTAYEITPRMTWNIRTKSWEDFPLNQKWFAVGEAIAHLELLIREGEIYREKRGSYERYYPVHREE